MKDLIAAVSIVLLCASPAASDHGSKRHFTMYWAAYAAALMTEKACVEVVAKRGSGYISDLKEAVLKDAEHDGYPREKVIAKGTEMLEETLPNLNDATSRDRFCSDVQAQHLPQ
ncbi:hypothetical protein [Ensifer sp.]|jgi:hypothetical protein|uniref:hypothetical protein n=1 Tax=Ensifer sp. TaxID=1872086 RepID=UPI002E1516A0|nr:hypothetical protein [Ensifer sp.]